MSRQLRNVCPGNAAVAGLENKYTTSEKKEQYTEMNKITAVVQHLVKLLTNSDRLQYFKCLFLDQPATISLCNTTATTVADGNSPISQIH